MRTATLSGTSVDTEALGHPFLPNNTVVVINPTGSAANVTSSDAAASGFATLIAVPALSAVEVNINARYLRASAGTLIMLGN